MSRKFARSLCVGLLVSCVAANASEAAVIDLTSAGADGSFTAGTDYFIQIPDQSTGTGVIDPFVRLIDGGGTTSEGYNTDGNPKPFDVNNSPQFTHSLLLSAVPEVLLSDGFVYYQFLLDINQTGSNPLLSLNELQLFTASVGNLTGTSKDANGTLTAFGANATLIYDMDATADNEVRLNFALNSGSGSGDMFFYFRKPANINENLFVYLYSQFGPSPYPNNDGFEEWAILKCPPTNPTCWNSGTDSETPVPEPGTMLLLGSGLVLAASRLRRRPARK